MEKADLATFQRQFLSALDAEDLASVFAKTLSAKDRPPISFSTRLGIYHTAVRVRLRNSLAGDFPQVKAILGQSRFAALTRAYLEKHPPHSPGLAELGKLLPRFIESSEGSWNEYPELADVANFEWQLTLAAWSPGAPALDLARIHTLANEDPSQLIFAFHPSVHPLTSKWQVDRLGTTELPGKRNSVHLIVYRRGDHVFHQRMPRKNYFLLSALHRATPIGELTDVLSRHRISEQRALELVVTWIQEGWIIDFRRKI